MKCLPRSSTELTNSRPFGFRSNKLYRRSARGKERRDSVRKGEREREREWQKQAKGERPSERERVGRVGPFYISRSPSAIEKFCLEDLFARSFAGLFTNMTL